MKKKFTFRTFPCLALAFFLLASLSSNTLFAQLTGTKNIPGDYATIAAAVTDVNTVGVGAGGVVFNIAAGYTETITGVISLTATGTAANPITFKKNGAGANPLITAYTGGTGTPASAVQDGIFRMVGSDYVTIDGIDLTDNAANTANPATMEYGYALYKASATDGCQNNTIKNCVITLNRINNASGSGPAVDGSRGIDMVNAIPTAATTTVTVTAATGSNSNNKFYSNTIQNCNIGIALIGYAAASPYTLADTGNDVGGSSLSTGNTIKNFGGGGTTSPSAGIRTLAQYTLNISYNTINNNDGGGINHASTLRGIYQNTAAGASSTISFNAITIKGGGTTSQISAIENAAGATPNGNTISILNNTIQTTYTTATSASQFIIYNNGGAPTTLSINNNTISNSSCAGTGTTGGIYNVTSITNYNVKNNTISNFTRDGTSGTFYGIYTGSPTNGMFDGNVIDNISFTNTAATSGTMAGIYDISSGTAMTYINNVVKNFSHPSSLTFYGVRDFGTTGNKKLVNNQVFNVTTTPGGVGGMSTVYGISISTGSTDTIANNLVHTLLSTGTTGGTTGTLIGIYVNGGTTNSVFKNKVYNIATNSTGGSVFGIQVTTGTTNTLYNNFVGDLRTPFENAANNLIGINLTGGTNDNLYYNTVYLNAQSTGALFGSSALSASTSPTLTLNNNILVNNSIPNGATGYTVAYRRSSTTLTTYANASNNNLFFAGGPCANRLIFYDATTTYQTLAAYKALVAPRDAASVTEDPNFTSTTGSSSSFLHINTAIATQTNNGGVTVAGVSDDYDGDARGGTPDIGADEFSGITAVACAGAPVGGTASASPTNLCAGFSTTICLSGQTAAAGISIKWQSATSAGGPFTDISCAGANCYNTGPLAVGVYFYRAVVTCDNTGQTANSNVVTVTVNGAPPVTVSPASATVCGGVSVTLTAAGANTYSWTPSTGLNTTTGAIVNATPSATTTYTVTGTDLIGCTASASATVNVITSPAVSASATPASICNGGTSNLNATVTNAAAYAVTSIAYNPVPLPGSGVTALVTNGVATTALNSGTLDDGYWSGITIPFSFTFYGTAYTTGTLSTNGNFHFGTSTTGGYNNAMPTTTAPNAVIGGIFADLDLSPLAATLSNLRYFTDGSSPNRRFVIEFKDAGFYNSGLAQTSFATFQIILYETSNNIEVHITSLNNTTTNKVEGIENAAGTAALTVSGRNNTANWSGIPDAYRFYVPTYTFAWSPATFLSSTTISNPVASGVTNTTTYTVTVTDPVTNCTGTSTVIVTANPTVSLTTTDNSGIANNDGIICAGASATITASGGGTYAWSNGPNTAANTVTPATTTTYTVTVTDANSCVATATRQIVVDPLPNVTINPSAPTICQGEFVTLTATGGGTYVWSNGMSTSSITVNPNSTTTYTVVVTSAASCSASATAQVTVNPAPVLSATLTQPTTCVSADGAINLTVSNATGPFTYNWTTSGGSGVVNGQEDQSGLTVGTYYVTVTAGNGCTATAIYALDGPGGCSVCPTIPTLVSNPAGPVCPNVNTTFTASGLTNMGVTYGIIFKYFTGAAPADPYTGGTVMGTVANAGLTGGGSQAQINFTFATANTYFVYAILTPTPTDPSCRPAATKTFVVNANPTPGITVAETSGTANNDGIICTGASVSLTGTGGTSYSWSTGANTPTIIVNPAATTTYTVVVTNASGCTATTSVTITVNGLPTPGITIAETSGNTPNDGIICNGASVTLTGTGGTSYAWSAGGNTASITVSPVATTSYTVTVTNANGCTATTSVTITVNGLPTAGTTVSETSGIANNDGIICAGASATLTGTGGTSYSWSTGAVTASITVTPAITTTYTVVVTNANGCSATTSRTITVNSLPTQFTVTGGGSYCQQGPGLPVGLSGSQVGVNYQLQVNNANTGGVVAGTNAAISFGVQTTPGTYTVIATNTATGCTSAMTGSVAVSSFNCTVTISDPCVCKNNATTLTNGQFDETIKVNAPDGQVWTVTAVNGLYNQFSPQPPSAPFPITIGQTLTVLGGNMYQLKGVHVDALGYSVTVANQAGVSLSIGNSCSYPNPSITTTFPTEICVHSAQIPLVGNPGDANIVSATFRVNNVVTNLFDPAQGPGQYLITYTVDGGVPKAANANDPGCIQAVSTYVNVVATPSNLVCNDQVYVSLDADCTESILPDDVLEGSYGCYDDYVVDVDKTIPLGDGPWIPATFGSSDIGKNYQVRVRHLVSGNKCWGNLKVEDKLPPALNCQDYTIPCNTPNTTPSYIVNTLLIAAGQPTATDCQNVSFTYIDSEVAENCASGLSKTILRKWTATDGSGNTSTCIQHIGLVRPALTDVVTPPDYDDIDAPAFSCEDNIPHINGHPNPTPDWIESQGLQGHPYIFGLPEGCSINWEYHDFPIEVCDGTIKYRREWTIIDWCIGDGFIYNQIIKVIDNVGPEIACPANMTVSTDPFACCATINMPDVIVEDNCSRINNISGMIVVHDAYTGDVVNMVGFGGTLQDFPGNNHWDLDTLANFGTTPCLPAGTHTVTYIVEDDCGNTSSCNFTLTVQDLIPPVASCDETTTVAIGVDDVYDCYGPAGPNGTPAALDACGFAGVTWVKATTFNDGSYDNCNGVKFTVRRMAPYSDCILGLNSTRGVLPCDATTPSFPSEFERAISEQDSIKFYCCEVGTTQTVILAVYQVDVNGNIMVGADGTPIKNECMIQVEVQDKVKPSCLPPANVSVNCENFDPSLWAYGKPVVADNCCLDTSKVYQGQCGLQHSVNYSLFDTVCNKGTITRTFRVFDCHGLSSQCTQRVVVNYEQDYFVKFPNDVIVTVCDGTGNYGEPLFYGEDCELLGVSYEDEVFTVVPDACFKIERTWTIINWCTYNPNGTCIDVPNPNPNPIVNATANLAGPTVSACGTIAPWAPTNVKINPTDPTPTNYCSFYDKNANCYRYKQIIKVVDGQAPTGTYVVPDCSNQNWYTANNNQLWNEMYWWNNSIQTHDLCEEPTDICITGTDACSGSNINIEYLLFLDLDGDGVMETVVNSVNTGLAGLGWNNVLYNNLNTPNFSGGTPRAFDERPVPSNQKYGFGIQETVAGNNKTACVRWNTQQNQNTFVVPELPHGTHKIKWFLTDGCGNNKEYEYTFTVKDCKAPTVVCLNGLSVNIMPTGMITLWASDFLQYTEDNCTPSGQLKIGIRKCGAGTGFPLDAQGNPITSVTFTCAEQGSQCVELWSIDAAGNADRCETYVIVQDNLGNCQPGNTILVSGALKTELGDGIEEATVNVVGNSTFTPPFAYMDMAAQDGTYQFSNQVPLASTFSIAPEKDDNPLNGVTTYDLVLISKHILGLEPLNSPYKMIAADANKSGSITTFDIVELRKLVLGIYSELPNNTSWRFVDKKFAFPQPNNPFATLFPEVISFADAMVNKVDNDFVGVKIGDVNNSSVPNAQGESQERSVGTAIFDVEDRDVVAGQTYEVAFKAAQGLKGYQFTIGLDGLQAVGTVDAENVTENNFNLRGAQAMSVSIDGSQEFTVKFKALKSGRLSEMLHMSGEITRAEAYAANNESLTLLTPAFRFDGKTVSGLGFELYQNQPNPFVGRTSIGFFLPEATEATLSVYDESGRMVYRQKGQFGQGMNAITLDRALLNTTGMLYYKLETATDSATRQMLQAK